LDRAKLLLLNSLDFETVVLELLSNFLAFLEVVESVLLLDIVILRNLGANHISVVSELVLALVLHVALFLLVLLLAIDDAQEVITFSLGLSCKVVLTLVELLLASDLELSSLALHALLISDLLSASLTLTLFECALGTESINLRLSVGGFLLHLAETGNFSFLFFLDAAFLECLSDLTLDLFLVVTDDFLLLIELLLSELSLLGEGNLVGSLNLSDQTHVAGTLVISSLDLSLALVLDLASHLFLLLNLLFAFLNALNFSLLNLVHNNHGTSASGILADNLALLMHLKRL